MESTARWTLDSRERNEAAWSGTEIEDERCGLDVYAPEVDTATSEKISIRPFEEADRRALERLWERVFPGDPPRNAPHLVIDSKLRVQPELLLVAPEWRRRGFATQLVQAAELGLRKLGCPKVNLQIRATNSAVVAFYRRLGYEAEERVSMGRALDP